MSSICCFTILEDGRLTDNRGRTVSFDNSVIIMTSNAGSHLIPREGAPEDGSEKMPDRLARELETFFRPEFLNRVDEIVIFRSLSNDGLRRIAHLFLDDLSRSAARQQISLCFSEEIVERIAAEGRDPRFGARPLRRAVGKILEAPLSKEIIASNILAGDTVHVTLGSGEQPAVFKVIARGSLDKPGESTTGSR